MKTIIIGDVHGCDTALRALLDKVKPGAEDTLVMLGDLFDRGPDSFQVFTGDETESGTVVFSGMEMSYVAGTSAEGDYRIYTWLDERNQVQLYFLVSGQPGAASPVIDAIMDSIAFD